MIRPSNYDPDMITTTGSLLKNWCGKLSDSLHGVVTTAC